MMLYTRNYGMPVLVPLSIFLVKGSEFITFHKVIWNRYFELLHMFILISMMCKAILLQCWCSMVYNQETSV